MLRQGIVFTVMIGISDTTDKNIVSNIWPIVCNKMEIMHTTKTYGMILPRRYWMIIISYNEEKQVTFQAWGLWNLPVYHCF